MDIINFLNEYRSQMYKLESLDTESFVKGFKTLKAEIINLIYEPFKEKIVGTDGLADGSYNITIGNPDLIYKDVINIYADINSFSFDELIFKLDDPTIYEEFIINLLLYFSKK